MLKSQIKNDLTTALKAGEKEKVLALRFLLSQINNAEISGGRKELTDAELVKLINSQVKKLKESIVMFQKGQRNDLVEKTQVEIKILKAYLPQQMPDEQLSKAVDKILAQNPDEPNLGKLIGLCIKTLGDQTDGSRIAQMIKTKKSHE